MNNRIKAVTAFFDAWNIPPRRYVVEYWSGRIKGYGKYDVPVTVTKFCTELYGSADISKSGFDSNMCKPFWITYFA